MWRSSPKFRAEKKSAGLIHHVKRCFSAKKCQGFPNMPFVKCLSGFAEVPYQVPPWSLPVAPRMPKNRPREAYLVPAPKARLYPKVLIAKCLPGGAEGPYQGQPISPRKSFKNVPGTRLEGTFECKARLENAENAQKNARKLSQT